MSTKLVHYCRKKFCCEDPRLSNLDEVFTCFRRTILHIAVMSDDIKFAKKNSIFEQWSSKASLQMVELLITAEPDICVVKDEAQRTPLHLAAMNDRVDIMEALTEEGLPKAIHLKNDDNGETILHFCVKSNSSIETLELLVDKLALARASDPNIIINSKDNNDKTVLQLAAETGKMEMVHYLLESGNLKLEITGADFAEALNALSPENKNNLETRFLKYLGHDNKNNLEINTLSKNGDKHEGMKGRVDALMVVATLIAGIAFQAAMNPPGGVWQDDSKVNSTDDPVTFSYYLHRMFNSSVSGGLHRYLSKYPKGEQHSSNIGSFVYSLMDIMDNDKLISSMLYKGLILEDSTFTDHVLPYYNISGNTSSNSVFYPYLMLYAGYPILAYTCPAKYLIYIVTNGVALFVSLTIIFLIICGFMIETSVNQVRFLVTLMCISIICIAFGYVSILDVMLPDFYVELNYQFIIVQILFGVCCILGIGLFIWSLARKIVKLRKRTRHHHIGVIDYLKAVILSMDAKAAVKLVLFTVSYFALRYNGFLYYDTWSGINPFLTPILGKELRVCAFCRFDLFIIDVLIYILMFLLFI
ncbi:hypothetical protein MKX01_017839 [Papaver californicum]|nr:hypothetical protein MKX01_017839 [Papaver californicum]